MPPWTELLDEHVCTDLACVGDSAAEAVDHADRDHREGRGGEAHAEVEGDAQSLGSWVPSTRERECDRPVSAEPNATRVVRNGRVGSSV